MTATQETQAGATVVNRLTALPAWEAELVLSMRFWLDGAEGREKVWNSFAQTFGAAEGRTQLRLFEGLLSSLCNHARRPFVRHGRGCTCIGADEAVLLTLVREAAKGDIAEAAQIASLMVPAAQAELIALKSVELGRAMQQMTHRSPADPTAKRKPDRHLH